MAFLSKELCTIDREVPMDFDLESTSVKEYDNEQLAVLFKNLELKSFMKRISSEVPTAQLKSTLTPKRINDVGNFPGL